MNTVGILEKLIAFRTTQDRIDEIRKALSYVEGLLKKKGIWIRKHHLDGKPVMYACTRQTKKPDILLIPHIDVVEGEDCQFVPVRKGNFVWGRGAMDCKNHVGVAIKALLHFAGTGASVGSYFTTDEEIGGRTTRLLVDKGYVGKLNLMLDGQASIVYAQKGILNLKVSVSGKAGHGAMPWESVNANEELMKAYARIRKLIPNTGSGDHWHETVNIGIMRGGETINKAPDRAAMWLNIRLIENSDYRRLIGGIKRIRQVSKVEVLGLHLPYSLDPGSAVVRRFRRFMEKELKRKLPLERMHGATDAHNFSKVKEPVIIIGSAGGYCPHGRSERMNVKELVRFEKALIGFIEAENAIRADCRAPGRLVS